MLEGFDNASQLVSEVDSSVLCFKVDNFEHSQLMPFTVPYML